MNVIITCKYEKDQIKNSREKVETSFFPLKSLWGFFQTFKGTSLRSGWSNQAEIRTRPSSHACHRYLQVSKGSDEKQSRKSGDTVFPIITLSVTMETSGWIWPNSSKLSCMLSLPANMKRIRSRTAKKKWRHHFSHYKPMGIFFRRSRAANSAASGPSRPKFKLVQALMHVIITCKYEKDRMINSREKVETPFSPL